MPAPLNDDQIGKYLADPLSFPPEFKNWVVKYLEQHQPNLLIRQLVGSLLPSKIAGYPANAAKVLAGDGNWLGGIFTVSETVLSGAAANIDITPISGSYTHLLAVGQLRGDTAALNTNLRLRFNNDTGTTYYWTQLNAVGVTPGAAEQYAQTSITPGAIPANTASGSAAVPVVLLLPNYSATTFHKTVVSLLALNFADAGPNQWIPYLGGGRWANTAALTRITLFPAAGNFVQNSHLTIYGMGV